MQLFELWQDIPTGRENAISYTALQIRWGVSKRTVRLYLHKLSCFDSGDNLVLIRSSHNKGFYKTDNLDEIAAYRKECLNRGKNVFAAIKQCDRALNINSDQLTFDELKGA